MKSLMLSKYNIDFYILPFISHEKRIKFGEAKVNHRGIINAIEHGNLEK